MEVLKIVLVVVLTLISVALTVIVLMQEGKSAGLGAISGAADTYWGSDVPGDCCCIKYRKLLAIERLSAFDSLFLNM